MAPLADRILAALHTVVLQRQGLLRLPSVLAPAPDAVVATVLPVFGLRSLLDEVCAWVCVCLPVPVAIPWPGTPPHQIFSVHGFALRQRGTRILVHIVLAWWCCCSLSSIVGHVVLMLCAD